MRPCGLMAMRPEGPEALRPPDPNGEENIFFRGGYGGGKYRSRYQGDCAWQSKGWGREDNQLCPTCHCTRGDGTALSHLGPRYELWRNPALRHRRECLLGYVRASDGAG